MNTASRRKYMTPNPIGISFTNSLLNFVAPGLILARRTFSKSGTEFRSFFELPASRTFEDSVVFAIWLRELVQSRKSNQQIISQLQEANCPNALLNQLTGKHLKPVVLIDKIETLIFIDPAQRRQIQDRAYECLCARNVRRREIYLDAWAMLNHTYETLEAETHTMGANTRLPGT